MDLISVIIPVYNVEMYLRECLDSVINQTYRNLEIILVDDGSTDNSGKICDEYAAKDKRIIVIHIKNSGAAIARKIGFLKSHGKYISFIDSDDWIELNMYEYLYDIIQKYDVDIIIYKFFDNIFTNTPIATIYNHHLEKGIYDLIKIKQYVYPSLLFSDKYKKSILPPGLWDKLFKKELLEKNIMYINGKVTIGEDQLWSLPCLLDANKMYVSEQTLYHYRRVNNSITKRYKENFLEDTLNYINSLKQIIKNKNKYESFNEQIEKCIIVKIVNVISNELKNTNSSFKKTYNSISNVLDNRELYNYFKLIDYNLSLGIKSKIFYLLVKYRMISLIIFLYKINAALKKQYR